MITTRLYLDARALSSRDSEAPIKIQVNRNGDTALLSTGMKVLPSQWDKATLQIVRHPAKGVLNNRLLKMKLRVDDIISEMVLSGEVVDLTATEVKNAVQERLLGARTSATFAAVFEEVVGRKSPNTAKLYRDSMRSILRHTPDLMERDIRRFSKEWAEDLSDWLTENYAPNSRTSYLVKLGAVFNHAREQGLIKASPFREVSYGIEPTRKRDLTQSQLRAILNAEPESSTERKALDLFRFSFLAIAMNPVDVSKITPDSIYNGRIEYDRTKTGRHYSVRIEPELREMIDARMDGRFVFPEMNASGNYHTFCATCNKGLKTVAKRLGLPPVSLYWVRHSWASIAAELDVPIETISSALGHAHGAPVTLVYVHLSQKKVDDAHRRVLDYVLYDRNARI